MGVDDSHPQARALRVALHPLKGAIPAARQSRFRGIPGFRALLGVEGALKPLDAVFDQHDIEATWRKRAKAAQVVPRGEDDAALLHARDAAARTAVRAGCALSHFDEHKRAIAWVAHDEIDLAAAAAGRSIIARDQMQACRLKMIERRILGRIAALLGRCLVVLEKTH